MVLAASVLDAPLNCSFHFLLARLPLNRVDGHMCPMMLEVSNSMKIIIPILITLFITTGCGIRGNYESFGKGDSWETAEDILTKNGFNNDHAKFELEKGFKESGGTIYQYSKDDKEYVIEVIPNENGDRVIHEMSIFDEVDGSNTSLVRLTFPK
jgi:hypothetical protein